MPLDSTDPLCLLTNDLIRRVDLIVTQNGHLLSQMTQSAKLRPTNMNFKYSHQDARTYASCIRNQSSNSLARSPNKINSYVYIYTRNLEIPELSGKQLEFMSTIKRSRNIGKRFSDEQIKSLETMFDAESRPEQRLKMNLANKLGLQPRQVAIWFQNKRARSKSKYIENEYAMLKTKFDELASQFDIMRKENQTLLIQLQRLRDMAGQKDDEVQDNYKDRIKIAISENPEIPREAHSNELFRPSCNDAGKTVDYMEETGFLNLANVAQDSLTSPDNRCSFDSCTFLDDPAYSSQWWDFKF